MTRKPDTRCAGTCGKLLWGGRGALPPGQRMCRPCRVSVPRLDITRSCEACGSTFTVRHRAIPSRACSVACGAKLRQYSSGPCVDCGQQTERQATQEGRLCVACALDRRRAYFRAKNAVRRGVPRPSRRLSIIELGTRDAWKCHLCRRRVDPRFRSPHPKSPTFDHLVPVADGGNDEPENLRLAHRDCNVRRGTRGAVQLLLVG